MGRYDAINQIYECQYYPNHVSCHSEVQFRQPARPAISHLIQTFASTRSEELRKGYVIQYRPLHIAQDYTIQYKIPTVVAGNTYIVEYYKTTIWPALKLDDALLGRRLSRASLAPDITIFAKKVNKGRIYGDIPLGVSVPVVMSIQDDLSAIPVTITATEDSQSYGEGAITATEDGQSHGEGTITVTEDGQSHGEVTITATEDSQSYGEGAITATEDSQSHGEVTITVTEDSQSYGEGAITATEDSQSHGEGTKISCEVITLVETMIQYLVVFDARARGLPIGVVVLPVDNTDLTDIPIQVGNVSLIDIDMNPLLVWSNTTHNASKAALVTDTIQLLWFESIIPGVIIQPTYGDMTVKVNVVAGFDIPTVGIPLRPPMGEHITPSVRLLPRTLSVDSNMVDVLVTSTLNIEPLSLVSSVLTMSYNSDLDEVPIVMLPALLGKSDQDIRMELISSNSAINPGDSVDLEFISTYFTAYGQENVGILIDISLDNTDDIIVSIIDRPFTEDQNINTFLIDMLIDTQNEHDAIRAEIVTLVLGRDDQGDININVAFIPIIFSNNVPDYNITMILPILNTKDGNHYYADEIVTIPGEDESRGIPAGLVMAVPGVSLSDYETYQIVVLHGYSPNEFKAGIVGTLFGIVDRDIDVLTIRFMRTNIPRIMDALTIHGQLILINRDTSTEYINAGIANPMLEYDAAEYTRDYGVPDIEYDAGLYSDASGIQIDEILVRLLPTFRALPMIDYLAHTYHHMDGIPDIIVLASLTGIMGVTIMNTYDAEVVMSRAISIINEHIGIYDMSLMVGWLSAIDVDVSHICRSTSTMNITVIESVIHHANQCVINGANIDETVKQANSVTKVVMIDNSWYLDRVTRLVARCDYGMYGGRVTNLDAILDYREVADRVTTLPAVLDNREVASKTSLPAVLDNWELLDRVTTLPVILDNWELLDRATIMIPRLVTQGRASRMWLPATISSPMVHADRYVMLANPIPFITKYFPKTPYFKIWLILGTPQSWSNCPWKRIR